MQGVIKNEQDFLQEAERIFGTTFSSEAEVLALGLIGGTFSEQSGQQADRVKRQVYLWFARDHMDLDDGPKDDDALALKALEHFKNSFAGKVNPIMVWNFMVLNAAGYLNQKYNFIGGGIIYNYLRAIVEPSLSE